MENRYPANHCFFEPSATTWVAPSNRIKLFFESHFTIVELIAFYVENSSSKISHRLPTCFRRTDVVLIFINVFHCFQTDVSKVLSHQKDNKIAKCDVEDSKRFEFKQHFAWRMKHESLKAYVTMICETCCGNSFRGIVRVAIEAVLDC